MRLRWDKPAARREPDLTSLINVVFLILIFFIVAGTLRPFAARDMKLSRVVPSIASAAAPGRLLIQADGRMIYRGEPIGIEQLSARARADRASLGDKPFVIVADARLDAAVLLAAVRALRSGEIASISVLAEKKARQ